MQHLSANFKWKQRIVQFVRIVMAGESHHSSSLNNKYLHKTQISQMLEKQYDVYLCLVFISTNQPERVFNQLKRST